MTTTQMLGNTSLLQNRSVPEIITPENSLDLNLRKSQQETPTPTTPAPESSPALGSEPSPETPLQKDKDDEQETPTPTTPAPESSPALGIKPSPETPLQKEEDDARPRKFTCTRHHRTVARDSFPER